MFFDNLQRYKERLWKLPIRRFVLNSAEVQSNDVFICREGERVDSHDFADEAVQNGAVAVIANKPLELSVPVFLTESYYQSVALVNAFYDAPQTALNHIGVTGTNGKTTVAYLLYQALSMKHKSAYVGTLGAMIDGNMLPLNNTTPDSIRLMHLFASMLREGVTENVMELSSHALAQDRAGFVDLNVGVVTNIGQDHLDYHKTRDNYIRAKMHIFDRIQPNGTAVINLNDSHSNVLLSRASKRLQVITFGVERMDADLIASDVELREEGCVFTLRFQDESRRVSTQLPFSFNVENALAMAATLLALRWPFDDVVCALRQCVLPAGRSTRIALKNGAIGLVDYAHNAEAMERLLQEARKYARNIVTVVGVTGDRIQDAASIGKACSTYSDRIIFTTDNPLGVPLQHLFTTLSVSAGNTRYSFEPDRARAIRLAISESRAGDWVIACGKGNETYQYMSEQKKEITPYEGDINVFLDESFS